MVWKKIKDTNYSVSDSGLIRNNNTKKTLKPFYDKTGYCRIDLGCKHKGVFVHRLVGIYFIDNPHNYKEINHKNEIKDDNRVDNLEWCDRKYNCNYGTRNEKISKHNKLKIWSPYEIDRIRNIGYNNKKKLIINDKIFDSVNEASKYIGIHRATLSEHLSGKRLCKNIIKKGLKIKWMKK